MSFKQETYTKKSTTLQLTGDDIIASLKQLGLIKDEVKPNVSFCVPSGGDWSGMTVDIDNENFIKVTYEEVEVNEVEL